MIFSQSKAPVLEAMTQHLQNRVVPFDVPGHKGGQRKFRTYRFSW